MTAITTAFVLTVGIVLGTVFAPFWKQMWSEHILPAGQWVKIKIQNKIRKNRGD